MPLEMYKQLEQIEKDRKMKLKLMLMMLYQEHEGKHKKFYRQQKHIKKRLLQKQKVKQVGLLQYIQSMPKQKK